MFRPRSLLPLIGGIASVVATEVVYVTDLEIFTVLSTFPGDHMPLPRTDTTKKAAPCAQSAVAYIVDQQTQSNCPEDATELQSWCGDNEIVTDDQSSAATVLSAYCNQDSAVTFPSPSITVSEYVTDLTAYQNLAPCASTAVSDVILAMTYDRCPSDPSLFATCVCDKNQNSIYASSRIHSSVKYHCSSHTRDVSSALAVLDGYCGLVDGTSSFPDTTNPPGDMTYFITALDEYSSLAPCARSAVSYNVLSLSNFLCPAGPQAMASCACLRSDIAGPLSHSITSDVRYSCETGASDDVTSAIDVWELYCSAAKGLTTIAHITESIADPSATPGRNSNGAHQTGPTNIPSDGSGSDNEATNSSNTAAIAGAVVGSVIGTALIAAVAFLIYRRKKKAAAIPPPVIVSDNGKPELDSMPLAPGTSTSLSPSMMKSPTEGVSPLSALSSPNSPRAPELPGQAPFPPPPPMPELHNSVPRTPELPGQNSYAPTRQEAYSQQVYEAPGQYGQPTYGAQGQAQGMGWQSGPMSHSYEMDGGHGRQQGTSP
ncbi:hypothetical protein GGS20DRAFT_585693 [Poronia punctata]|nr:hypothetical protein GGS20DRAFT_585693 [Poronia punctata]